MNDLIQEHDYVYMPQAPYQVIRINIWIMPLCEITDFCR